MSEMVGQPQNLNIPITPGTCGVNIQIINPAPCAQTPAAPVSNQMYSLPGAYPQNYYTQRYATAPQMAPQAVSVAPTAQTPPAEKKEEKKTEKREVVEITDSYVKNLESYLNNQNPKVRLMGAKEVLARLQEDPSRKDDPALNALVNKMLQDPYQPIKFIAMAALESRDAKGDNKSVKLLQQIQQGNTGYGEDSLKASNILLKMSAHTTEKEFEVKEDKRKQQGEK